LMQKVFFEFKDTRVHFANIFDVQAQRY
jgi:hypothetical protein